MTNVQRASRILAGKFRALCPILLKCGGTAALATLAGALLYSDASIGQPKFKSVSLGYTFTHTHNDCPEKGGATSTSDAQDSDELGVGGRRGHKLPSHTAAENIILHYDQAQVASYVNNVLQEMRANADALRLMVWLRMGEANSADSGQDLLGTISSKDGQIPANDLKNISAILGKAQALGYSKAYVVFGNQGTSGPRCRGGGNFGDCFDPSLLAADWQARKQIIGAIGGAGLDRMPVYYDLAAESCPDGAVSAKMHENLDQYARYMLRQYAQTYGDHKFYISCHGKPLQRAIKGLDGIVDLYRSLGIVPHAIDVHLYVEDQQLAETVLTHAAADAESLGVPLTVLETAYDDNAVFSAISDLRSKGQLGRLETVSIWLKNLNSPCGQNLNLPIDFSHISKTLRP